MTVFLALLLLAVQVVFHLYATSSLTAAAYDGARLAAGAGAADDPLANEAAEAHVRGLLGDYGRRRVVSFDWHGDAEPGYKVLTVTAVHPSFLPPALRAPLGMDRVQRTVRVRLERGVALDP